MCISFSYSSIIKLNELLPALKGVFAMSSRDELAKVIANDPRYSIEAHAFLLESLNQAAS